MHLLKIEQEDVDNMTSEENVMRKWNQRVTSLLKMDGRLRSVLKEKGEKN